MFLPWLALAVGIVILVYSADVFVEGASALAGLLGMSPLLIGVVIVGFGTSTPEMIVSTFAALDGYSGIALGNVYGSNIVNISLILGLTVLLRPLVSSPKETRADLIVLAGATAIAIWQMTDLHVSRFEAVILLLLFALVMTRTVWSALKSRVSKEKSESATQIKPFIAVIKLVFGLALLMGSSKALVWGAEMIARELGVSDLIIGLTIVAVGTSLPELASSIAAARKGEHELALGNVIGSNFFNTLAVVGLAGTISPMAVDPAIMSRDIPVVIFMTLLLIALCKPWSKKNSFTISRLAGFLLLACFVGYNIYLVVGELG